MRVVLFLLPGFGLHDEDYSRLIASSGVDSHVTFDVWPRTVEEVERTNIGIPGQQDSPNDGDRPGPPSQPWQPIIF